MFIKLIFVVKKNLVVYVNKAKNLFNNELFFLKKTTLLYVIALSVFQILLVLFYLFYVNYRQKTIELELSKLENSIKSFVVIKNKKEALINKFNDSDQFYIEHYIEPLVFLNSDIKTLVKIRENTKELPYKPMQEKIEFLVGDKNKIKFEKDVVRNLNNYSEIEWKMSNYVIVNYNDIIKLLTLIEGVKIGGIEPNRLRPDLCIKKLHLTSSDNEPGSFSLNVELLQRQLYENKKK